ncbi:MAG: CoA pyrophosphatase [Ignavibacteriaceae bacterium]
MDRRNFNALKESLSPVPVILQKDEFLNTAVLIPLISINDEFHFLFEKRSANIRQGGEICFPGGEHDEGDDSNFEETAIRETIEELGIQKNKIELIGELGILFGGSGAIIHAFIGELKIKDLNNYNIDETEVEKIFTIPVSFFQNNPPEVYHVRLESHPYYFNEHGEKIILLPVDKLKLPERYANPWGIRKRKVLVYKTGEDIVWGMTANLVHEFVNKLNQLK